MTQWGMIAVNVTQGRYSPFSHDGTNAVDIAGNDSGINGFYAHQDYKVTQKFTGEYGNGVAFQSVNKMKFKDGSTDYLTLLMWHDNYISDLSIGQIIKSGNIMFSEGTSGYATGNHIHLECGKGHQHISSLPPDYGMHVPHWTNVENVFYLVDNTVKINDGGYNWAMENTTKYYFKVSAAKDNDDIKKYNANRLRNTGSFILQNINETAFFKEPKLGTATDSKIYKGSEVISIAGMGINTKTSTEKDGYKYLWHPVLEVYPKIDAGDAVYDILWVAYKKYK